VVKIYLLGKSKRDEEHNHTGNDSGREIVSLPANEDLLAIYVIQFKE
jgi:hypothetical protein